MQIEVLNMQISSGGGKNVSLLCKLARGGENERKS
jgi:hypothetical protein